PMARDLADLGIRVNSIMPGIFATPLMLGAQPKVLESLAASVPFPKRLGKPQEFGSLALEIARNTYFNGQCVRLDGSIRMAPRCSNGGLPPRRSGSPVCAQGSVGARRVPAVRTGTARPNRRGGPRQGYQHFTDRRSL